MAKKSSERNKNCIIINGECYDFVTDDNVDDINDACRKCALHENCPYIIASKIGFCKVFAIYSKIKDIDNYYFKYHG